MKGGVPLKVLLKRTVALGRAAWDSGRVTKLGGSEEDKTERVKEVLTVALGLHDLSSCLTFHRERSAAHTASCCIGQFASVGSCVSSLELFDLH